MQYIIYSLLKEHGEAMSENKYKNHFLVINKRKLPYMNDTHRLFGVNIEKSERGNAEGELGRGVGTGIRKGNSEGEFGRGNSGGGNSEGKFGRGIRKGEFGRLNRIIHCCGPHSLTSVFPFFFLVYTEIRHKRFNRTHRTREDCKRHTICERQREMLCKSYCETYINIKPQLSLNVPSTFP